MAEAAPNSLSMPNESASTASADDGRAIAMDAANLMQSTAGGGELVVDLQCSPMPQLQLKLPELLSSSSSDSEGDEQQTTNADGGANAAATSSSGRAASPPPNCAICLGRCKNKCFTDSCMHQFCFKCLCEWSKVKPECPLCKQTFKSIIHNVKSIDQFEEYHVQQPTVQIPSHRPIELSYRAVRPYIVDNVFNGSRNDYEISVNNWDGPRAAHRLVRAGRAVFFPFAGNPENSGSSNVTGGASNASGNAGNLQNQFIHRGELLDMYRQENPDAIASSGTLSQLWRRYVYDRKLYALPVCDITGRFRESNARFYRDNPALIVRLMPWINRDIVCLLRNTEHDVTAMMERINDSLIQSNILSPAFLRRLLPYLGSKTGHFIHELNNFARSPYDMVGYDRAVQYSPQTAEEIVIEFSSSASSDEDNVNVIDGSATSGGSSARSAARSRVRAHDAGVEYRVQTRGTNSSAATTSASATSQPQQPHLVNMVSFTISSTSEGVEAPGISVAVGGRGTQSTAINLTTHNRAVIIDLDDMELDVATSAAGENGRVDDGASTSNAAAASGGVITSASSRHDTPTVTDNIELTSSSSDECEFVLERKPPHLRTPEMVSLNSESDSDVVFVEESKWATSSEGEETTTPATVAAAAASSGRNKNSQPQHAQDTATTSTSTSAYATRATVVKNEQEVYNVGASTSAGLRSTGRKRRQKSLDDDKRCMRRQQVNPRTLRSTKDKSVAMRRRGSQTSPTSYSSTSASETDDDVDVADEDYVRPRKVARSGKQKPYGKRVTRARLPGRTTTNKASSSKRNHQNEPADVGGTMSKRLKFRAPVSESDYSSEEDESLSLKVLKRRLVEQRQREGRRSTELAMESDMNALACQLETSNPANNDEADEAASSGNDDDDDDDNSWQLQKQQQQEERNTSSPTTTTAHDNRHNSSCISSTSSQSPNMHSASTKQTYSSSSAPANSSSVLMHTATTTTTITTPTTTTSRSMRRSTSRTSMRSHSSHSTSSSASSRSSSASSTTMPTTAASSSSRLSSSTDEAVETDEGRDPPQPHLYTNNYTTTSPNRWLPAAFRNHTESNSNHHDDSNDSTGAPPRMLSFENDFEAADYNLPPLYSDGSRDSFHG